MSKLKVTHVYRTYFPDPPGGLQEAIRQICLATAAHDVDASVFTLSPNPVPPKVERLEGTVTRARSYWAPASCDIGGIGSVLDFAKAVADSDLVHYHFPWPFADVLHLAARVKKPAVMTYHSDVVGKGMLDTLYRPLMTRMLGSMDAVVATSPPYASSSPVLAEHVSPERLHVIPLGIVEESYEASRIAARSIDVRARFGLEPNRYFLFIGVLRKYKGLQFLVEAAKNVDFQVAIAGSGPEGQSVEAASAGAPNLHLLGQINDAEKMALLRDCRAVILPSHLRSEAFGVVLLEAAMCGKPMISCEIETGTSYANADGETGIVVAPERPELLARAMQSLHDDEELVTRFGTAARDRYERLFSDRPLGAGYGELYRSVMEKRRRK